MLKKIEDILKELNIDVAYQSYVGNADEYIIFDIYAENDSEFADDTNFSLECCITLNYWHKSLTKVSRYRQIKDLLKSKGFFFNGMKSLKQEKGYYGKNFDFILEED